MRHRETGPHRLRAIFMVTAILGAVLASGLAHVPAEAASETFSESFRGSSLPVPLRWTSSRGATGPGPGGVTEPSEYACLTALAPGQSITVQGVAGIAAADRPGSGLIVGCPNTASPSDPIDSVGAGALRLTREAHTQSTVVVYNEPQKMSDGLDITFSFAIHSGRTSSTATGADGLSFFIKDGANLVDSPGASGGALGYALSATGAAGADSLVAPGLPGALLGVGFDFWGNFSYLYNASARISRSCGASGFGFGENIQLQDLVVLRGPDTSTSLPKDGSCGYEYLGRSAAVDFGRSKAGVLSPGDITGVPAASRAGGARRARIVIDKPGPGARVKVWVWTVGAAQPTMPVLDLAQPAALQGIGTFKFGFGASTGWATNVHEIWDLSIILADPVVQTIQATAAAEAAAPSGPSLTCAPDPVQPGQDVTCTLASGPAGADVLWRATIGSRVVDTRGVAIDETGVGEFVFAAPRDAAGSIIDIELVDWGADTEVDVTAGPVPTRVDAGSGTGRSAPYRLLLLAGLAAMGAVRTRRQVPAS